MTDIINRFVKNYRNWYPSIYDSGWRFFWNRLKILIPLQIKVFSSEK